MTIPKQEPMTPDPARAMRIGFLAGLVVAIGGAIKDAPYEGFKPLTFMRSPIIGAIEAPILADYFDWPQPLLLALATVATERATTEGYKILRCQRPGKFEVGEWGIPKQLMPGIETLPAVEQTETVSIEISERLVPGGMGF